MKGLLIEKGKGYYILLTPDGEYRKIMGKTNYDIGDEVHISNAAPVRAYAAAAAVLLVMASLTAWMLRISSGRVAGYVTVDISSRVEFAIDNQGRVLKANPLNEEASQVLAGISFQGREVEEVLADFTQMAMSFEHISPDKENHVAISAAYVNEQDEEAGREKLARIAAQQKEILEQSRHTAVIETGIVSMDVQEDARQLGISPLKVIESNKDKGKDKDHNKDQDKKDKSDKKDKKDNKDKKDKKDSKDLGNKEEEKTKDQNKDKPGKKENDNKDAQGEDREYGKDKNNAGSGSDRKDSRNKSKDGNKDKEQENQSIYQQMNNLYNFKNLSSYLGNNQGKCQYRYQVKNLDGNQEKNKDKNRDDNRERNNSKKQDKNQDKNQDRRNNRNYKKQQEKNRDNSKGKD